MGFWLWVYNEPKNRNFSFYQFEKAALMNLTVTTFSSRFSVSWHSYSYVVSVQWHTGKKNRVRLFSGYKALDINVCNMKSEITARKNMDWGQVCHTGMLLFPAKWQVEGFGGCEGHSVKSHTSLFPFLHFGQAENQPKHLRGSWKNERVNEFSQIS